MTSNIEHRIPYGNLSCDIVLILQRINTALNINKRPKVQYIFMILKVEFLLNFNPYFIINETIIFNQGFIFLIRGKKVKILLKRNS